MELTIDWKIICIREESPDAHTFFLTPVSQIHIKVQAGQFLTLLFYINQTEHRRSYSISFIQEAPDFMVGVTVRRIENGLISRYMFEKLKEEGFVRSLYPSGLFTLERTKPDILIYYFVAGGIGITPIFALIKEILFNGSNTKITLLYASREERHAIFFIELEVLKSAYPDRLFINYFFSRQYTPKDLHHINQHIVALFAPPALRSECYLCGPSALTRMTKMTLRTMGWTSDQIHLEEFIPPVIRTPTTLPRFARPVKAVFLLDRTYEINLEAGKTVLDAALEQGISLPYSCKGGICTSCLCLCTEGKVIMPANHKLFDKDVENGWTLTCIAYPATPELTFSFNTDEKITA